MIPKPNKLSGVITALVTPFEKGELDLKSFGRLIKDQLDQGVDGFVINGTTAESPTLTINEVEQLFSFARSEVAGQVPLIVGTGSNSTAKTCEITRKAAGWGAEAALVVVPYYNKPPQRGLVQHFKEVARSSTLPVIIYNVPSRTITAISTESVAELSREKGIIGIKEASGSMETLRELRASAQDDFVLLSGDDGSCVEFCAGGGHGVISVSSHLIGRQTADFIRRAKGGERDAPNDYSRTYSEFLRHLYIEANPIAVKMALYWRGILSSPELRLPLCSLAESHHKEFKACLENLKLI